MHIRVKHDGVRRDEKAIGRMNQLRDLHRPNRFRNLVVAVLLLPAAQAGRAADDPLPSWNDTAPKKAIEAFVEKVTT